MSKSLNPVIVESLLAVDVSFGLSTGLFPSVTDFSLQYDADNVSWALWSTWVLDELISSLRQAELFSSSKLPATLSFLLFFPLCSYKEALVESGLTKLSNRRQELVDKLFKNVLQNEQNKLHEFLPARNTCTLT